MKVGIVVFPGSNCERDAQDAVTQYMGKTAEYLWYEDNDLKNVDAVILPGGFSYGDYLRSGAIARFAPMMAEVKQFAYKGGPVIGICNGFQVLTECGLLPGALNSNRQLKFICEQVLLKVENTNTPFTTAYQKDELIHLPVAHGDGNYVANPDTIKQLEDNGQVVFRYMDDVNGSINQIAGICNEQRNVVGLMPHPERNLWQNPAFTGDGAKVFDSLLNSALKAVSA